LVLQFETRTGPRRVELSTVGQRAEWLLPGPGFAKGDVAPLSVAPSRVQARVLVKSEGNIAAGRMFQTQSTMHYESVQQGNRLTAQIQVIRQTINTGGGVGMTNSQSRTVLRGELRRSE
jgi:hypothetical protein